MGHALNGSIQDVLIRWHRMRGFDTLWQAGYDHAGISTQNVIEKQLIAEGTSRQEIGRDAFLERTWRWLDETGRTIMGQYRRLGASLDYSRERFTMDEAYVEAVMTFFVRLWDAGWIYRANRIVNWCPYHQTAISDLEVEHVEMDDTLSYVRYPFADGEGGIPVATVRPATMLADVAVAVHPDDPRYREAIGREVVVPGRRATGAGRRRRARRPRVRDRRRQGDARPRPDGLRDRPRPRARDPHRDRPGRPADRSRIRGSRPEGGRRPGDRVGRGARPGGEARAVPALGRHVRAVPFAHRAARLAAVVVWHGGARHARAPGAPRAARPFPPGEPAPLRDRVARAGAGLVRLAPAVVGTPDPDLDVPRRAPDLRLAAARRVRRVRLRRARARPRRPRHLVLVGALAVRDARLAGRGARARALLPGRRQLDGARDHPPVGEPDDLLGALPPRRDPLHRRDHPLDGPRCGRAPDVEEPRHGRRPDGAGRGTRRGRDALRPPQDLLDAGRPLRGRRDRGGPQAREQAVERRPADPAAGRGRHARGAPRRARGAVDPRPTRRRPRRGRGGVGSVRLRVGDGRPLPPHVRRFLRLVRRGRQAAPVRRRRELPCDGARGARDDAGAPAPADAARDRGDLVAPSRRGLRR